MLADELPELHASQPDGDGIEAEMAFLQELLERAGDAGVPADELASSELLREEGAITTPRPRFERRGPTLTQVAAVGLATFPAALTPVPAFAATQLPPNLAMAMAARPPAPPVAAAHHTTTAADVFAFSHSMNRLRAQTGTPQVSVPTSQAFRSPHLPVVAGVPVAPRAAVESPEGVPADGSKAIASSGLQLNPQLRQLFQQQRKLAVTSKRQLSSTFYQVSDGDSLYSISADLLGSGSRWREIYAANHVKIGTGYTLRPGQKLVIPTPRHVPDVKLAHFKGQPANSPALANGAPRYLVGHGDSLYTIAAKRLHNANRWREIVALNKAMLNGRTVIYPNQWLTLPSVT